MPLFVTALYDGAEQAQLAIEALQQEGFKASDIQHIDREREEKGFFQRLFLDGDGERPEDKRHLSVMGIDHDQVDFYSELVRQGYSLVIVLCDEQRLEEAWNVLRRFDVLDPDDLILRERRFEASEEGERPVPRLPSGEPSGRWFDVVEVREEEWHSREGARAHAVHVESRPQARRLRLDELPGADYSPTYRRLEPEFRRHYAQNYADSGRSYEDLRLAYRFGVQLAENPAFRRQNWAGVEESAQESWTDHGAGPWEEFNDAVEFAWQMARTGGHDDARL